MKSAKTQLAAALCLAVVATAELHEEVRNNKDSSGDTQIAKGRAGALQVSRDSWPHNRGSPLKAFLRHAADGGGGIHPPVEEADRRFFEKDYPADGRPDVRTHFSHPYPEVQDSDDYDNDFVKDENGDNGYYDAQMAYDRLRTLKRKEEVALRDEIKKGEQEANAARAKARATGAGAGSGSGSGSAGKAKSLGSCDSAELEAALKKLAELMDEKGTIEEKRAAAEAAVVPLREKRWAIKKQMEALTKDLHVHEHRYSELEKEHALAKSNLRKGEDELKKALIRLRKIRTKKLNENSEIYEHIPRSGATTPAERTGFIATVAFGLWIGRG